MSRVGLCYFALMLITQALQLAGVLALNSLLQTGWGLWVLSYVPLYGVGAPVFLVLMRRLLPDAPGTFGTAVLTKGAGARWLVLCLGMTYLLNFVSLGILALVSLAKGGAVTNPLAVMQTNSNPVATFLFACVLAPAGEEWLFRKLLYDKIGAYGTRVYIIVGGVVFALFHANLSQMLYAFALGAAFCYIYAHTGRLWYVIALHMAVNTVGTGIVPLAAQAGVIGAAAVSALVIVCIPAGVVIALRKRWRFAPETTGAGAPDADPGTPGRALRAPGMLAYLVLCAALICVVTFLS